MSEDFLGKVPPASVDAELAVIGGILLHNDALDRVAEHVRPADFYVEAHSTIFQAIIDLDSIGRPIDLISLSEALRERGEIETVGGLSYLSRIVDAVPTSANIETHSQIVAEKSAVRSCIGAALGIMQRGYGDYGDARTYLDEAEQSIFEATRRREEGRLFKISSAFISAFAEIDTLREHGGDVTGVATGFTDLDRMTTGFQPGDLVIVAGRPAMGKTSFALKVAVNVAKTTGRGAIVFSLEMGINQLVSRILSFESKVEAQKIRVPNRLSQKEYDQMVDVTHALGTKELYLDDSASLDVLEMRSRARYLKSKTDLACVIIDYLQIMKAMRRLRGETSREREVADTTRALKAMAKELALPVVCLSQLNRSCEQRPDKRPRLSDLRESGAIEQDADLILFLYRDAVYSLSADDTTCEVIVGKNRNGPTGLVRLSFVKERTSFESMLDARTHPKDTYEGMLGGQETRVDLGEPDPF